MEELTPKQKADELIDKYYNLFAVDLENTISKYESVHCATMAVEEIISQCEYIDAYLTNLKGALNHNLKFWNEVLTELKAML